MQVKTNFYYMGYKDQLILTGELDDVGAQLEK
jgi:iron complex outermembrane receptor protein